MGYSGDAAQFGYSAGLDPFDYKDVAGVIEAGAVRADEPAGAERAGKLVADGSPIFSGMFGFAEGCDYIILAAANPGLASMIRFSLQTAVLHHGLDARVLAAPGCVHLRQVLGVAAGENHLAEAVAVGARQAAIILKPLVGVVIKHLRP
jgi:hypothetical protein